VYNEASEEANCSQESLGGIYDEGIHQKTTTAAWYTKDQDYKTCTYCTHQQKRRTTMTTTIKRLKTTPQVTENNY
jgi:hypothetical protein